MLESQTLLLLIPKHLYISSPPFLAISPKLTSLLQKATQPDFDASVCINKFGSFCLSDLQLFNLKFSTQQRSSCFDRLLNTISVWYEKAWFSDYIYCCCKYRSNRRACRTAWTVEDIRHVNFVNSKTVN